MAIAKLLRNTYRSLGNQDVTAYCVMAVDAYQPDVRQAIIRLAAFDGPCTKEQRRLGEMTPFLPTARREIVTGDLFEQYFNLDLLDQPDNNLLKQAYRCATRSIPVPVTDPDTGAPQLDEQGQPLMVESNEWAGLPEV